jgi:hypothetical protein
MPIPLRRDGEAMMRRDGDTIVGGEKTRPDRAV